MSKKRAYVSPQVTRVKLDPTQAVLSQCSLGETSLSNSNPSGSCKGHGACKAIDPGHGGDTAATS